MTKAELEAKLEADLAAEKITVDEAEAEWQDYMHRDEVWEEW